MSADTYSTRWRVLALLGFAELLGMSLWFSASAVTPQLRSIWGLTTAEAAWLTSVVQLGFVCGIALCARPALSDGFLPSRRLPSSDEDDGHLVPSRAWPCDRRDRGRAHHWKGDPISRAGAASRGLTSGCPHVQRRSRCRGTAGRGWLPRRAISLRAPPVLVGPGG